MNFLAFLAVKENVLLEFVSELLHGMNRGGISLLKCNG